MDWRGWSVDDVGVLTQANGTGDVAGMDFVFGVCVSGRRNNIVDKERPDVVDEGGTQCILHVTRSRRRSDDRVERMRRTH